MSRMDVFSKTVFTTRNFIMCAAGVLSEAQPEDRVLYNDVSVQLLEFARARQAVFLPRPANTSGHRCVPTTISARSRKESGRETKLSFQQCLLQRSERNLYAGLPNSAPAHIPSPPSAHVMKRQRQSHPLQFCRLQFAMSEDKASRPAIVEAADRAADSPGRKIYPPQ